MVLRPLRGSISNEGNHPRLEADVSLGEDMKTLVRVYLDSGAGNGSLLGDMVLDAVPQKGDRILWELQDYQVILRIWEHEAPPRIFVEPI